MNPTSFAQAIRTGARALLTGGGAILVGALLLGLLLTGLRPPAAPQRDPDPVYRPARSSTSTDDLEQRVNAIERQQQRDRAARDAELFAPQPSYRYLDPLAPRGDRGTWP